MRSASTIIRIFMTYRPLHFFAVPGVVMCCSSLLLFGRYLYLYSIGDGGGHVQSLILASILLGGGLLAIFAGLFGDLISVNRKLLEKLDLRVQMLAESRRFSGDRDSSNC
jgi:hypothetical protein